MTPSWKWLTQSASDEVQALIKSLPREVRKKAQSIPVLLQPHTRKALRDEGFDDETMGVFEGPSLRDSEDSSPLPPQIILFLENIWESTEPDERLYRKEIRTTFLHELGHYLGLNESDLEQRSLD